MPEAMISQLQTDVWEMDLFCLMRLVTFFFFFFNGPLPADSELASRQSEARRASLRLPAFKTSFWERKGRCWLFIRSELYTARPFSP